MVLVRNDPACCFHGDHSSLGNFSMIDNNSAPKSKFELNLPSLFIVYATLSTVLASTGQLFRLWDGSLSLLWLPNGVLLGVLVRRRHNNRWAAFGGIAAGLLLWDLISGGEIKFVLVLLAGNLAFIGVGLAGFEFVPFQVRRLRQPQSVMFLAVIVAAAAFAMTFCVVVLGHLVLGEAPGNGFIRWFVIGFANGLAVLPVVLSAPPFERLKLWKTQERERRRSKLLGPMALLLLSLTIGMLTSIPAALALVLPALIWSALTAGLFKTSILSFLTLMVSLVLIGSSSHANAELTREERSELNSSIQLSYALMALGPLAVAASMATIDAEINRVKRKADHDALTGVLNRRGMFERAVLLLGDLSLGKHAVAVMVFDLDNFKQINDTYGHSVGDRVLYEVASLVQTLIRPVDVLGRMGGEEFVVVVPAVSADMACTTAERIRSEVERLKVSLANEPSSGSEVSTISVTLSIGITWHAQAQLSLSELLRQADIALYEAKLTRNHVILH